MTRAASNQKGTSYIGRNTTEDLLGIQTLEIHHLSKRFLHKLFFLFIYIYLLYQNFTHFSPSSVTKPSK